MSICLHGLEVNEERSSAFSGKKKKRIWICFQFYTSKCANTCELHPDTCSHYKIMPVWYMHLSFSPPERQGAWELVGWGGGGRGKEAGRWERWWLLIHQLGFSKILKVHALSSMNFKLCNLNPQGNPDFTFWVHFSSSFPITTPGLWRTIGPAGHFGESRGFQGLALTVRAVVSAE